VQGSVIGDMLEENMGETTDVKAKISIIKRQDSFQLNATAEEEPEVV